MHGLAKGLKLVVIFLDGFGNYMNRHLLKIGLLMFNFYQWVSVVIKTVNLWYKNRAI